MHQSSHSTESGIYIMNRQKQFFQELELQIHRRTDRLLAVLIIGQWLGGIAAALWISPYTWSAEEYAVHAHVWAVLILGGLITSLPLFLALTQPGRASTRHVMAVGQMAFASLLIHLTGGRIETHFQIFGILAFLAFYRDWRVLVSATLVTTADHMLRGMFWPRSIFGVLTVSPWRGLEHAGWVLFEVVFLLLAIRQNRIEMLGVADRQAKLESINTNIEHKVEERTAQLTEEISARKRQEGELARARDVAVESARLKAEFLANMSHEIRTPMNGIIGMTGLLLETPLVGEQREFVETIRSCGDSLLTIINDILDFSKIEAGKLSFETLDFDLRQTIESVVDLLAERAQTKQLELISLVQDDVPSALRGDPGRLRQVMINLAGNAIKFTERGEVVVRAALDSQNDQAAVIRFTVQDTGIGISEQGLRSLFLAFSQADGSVTRKYGGSGLGLAISKQLVEIMGGQIGVESKPGQGSTFYFTARFEKQPPAATCAPPVSLDVLRSLRALIVDDNATNRRVLQLQLRPRGVICEEAPGAEEGLLLLRRAQAAGEPFNIALIDMQMPDIDGLELARRIKADSAIAATELLMLSSMGSVERDGQARAVGVSLCLTKPVKQAKLYDALIALRTGRPSKTSQGPGLEELSEGDPQKSAQLQAVRKRAHILVAEDNPINQKVILRQLAKLGYRADAVANGLEALAAIEKIPYDLILMDCQMPEMDGYTAARELRKRPAGVRVHIIALTAHTMDGDREKCLAAGMDDYLGKPIKVEELAQKLGTWLSGKSKELPMIISSSTSDPVDVVALKQTADGDEAFLHELIDVYLSQADELIAALRRAHGEGAVGEIERIAHTLAGSSLASGMRAMVPPMRQLEAMARTGILQDPEPIIDRAGEELRRIREFLASLSLPN